MYLNSERMREIMMTNNLSQNKLSKKLNVTKGTVSRCLNGKRGVGRKFIAALIKAFPQESLESLVTKENTIQSVITKSKENPLEPMPIKVKPYRHQVQAYNFVGEKLEIFEGGGLNDSLK